MNTLPISIQDTLPAVNVPITFDPLKGLATVLSRSTGYYLIDGQTGRTLIYASPGSPRRIYRFAMMRGFRLVNAESVKGQAILDRLHSHATAR